MTWFSGDALHAYFGKHYALVKLNLRRNGENGHLNPVPASFIHPKKESGGVTCVFVIFPGIPLLEDS